MLKPLARHARSLTLYRDAEFQEASAWKVDFATQRLTVVVDGQTKRLAGIALVKKVAQGGIGVVEEVLLITPAPHEGLRRLKEPLDLAAVLQFFEFLRPGEIEAQVAGVHIAKIDILLHVLIAFFLRPNLGMVLADITGEIPRLLQLHQPTVVKQCSRDVALGNIAEALAILALPLPCHASPVSERLPLLAAGALPGGRPATGVVGLP